jgi:hypothetical protein
LGLHVGDAGEAVLRNRQAAAETLGFGLEDLVCAEQVHGACVAGVSTADRGRGSRVFAEALPGADALVAQAAEVPPLLGLYFADCLAILIADTRHHAVGLAHAGWRGTAEQIGAATLKVMGDAFGTAPADCVVALGPHIRKCCYQVGAELAERFGKVPGAVASRGGSPYLSLEAVNLSTLLSAGVPRGQVTLGSPCTCCSEELFFSYRRDGLTGRMGAFLAARDGSG